MGGHNFREVGAVLYCEADFGEPCGWPRELVFVFVQVLAVVTKYSATIRGEYRPLEFFALDAFLL